VLAEYFSSYGVAGAGPAPRPRKPDWDVNEDKRRVGDGIEQLGKACEELIPKLSADLEDGYPAEPASIDANCAVHHVRPRRVGLD
jgi:hypothetical protein